ncbi:MAG: hypothetical protein JRI55_23085 [Deltaproteobacteria bacterium]|nr:hypothetical protein [Deltaproteobacteria bacterium]
MAKVVYNIEDLTQVLSVRESALAARQADDEDLSIPIIVEDLPEGEVDETIHLIDDQLEQEQTVFVFDQGRYMRYRIGVLGIGRAAEQIFFELKEILAEAVDPLVEDINLWARYQVALFGGEPKGDGVPAADADLLADRLALFKPNYLVLVTAGQESFEDKTPQDLAKLSLQVNSGAIERRQRPYTLVLITEKAIGQQTFAMYRRFCVTMNTYPAEGQFRPEQIEELASHARQTLLAYTEEHLKVRS